MNLFDIIIAHIEWGSEGKKRPVLIFKKTEKTIIVFNITTQYENKSEFIRRKYFKINEYKQAGLDKESYVDTNTARNLPVEALLNKTAIGQLSESDVLRLIKFMSE